MNNSNNLKQILKPLLKLNEINQKVIKYNDFENWEHLDETTQHNIKILIGQLNINVDNIDR